MDVEISNKNVNAFNYDKHHDRHDFMKPSTNTKKSKQGMEYKSEEEIKFTRISPIDKEDKESKAENTTIVSYNNINNTMYRTQTYGVQNPNTTKRGAVVNEGFISKINLENNRSINNIGMYDSNNINKRNLREIIQMESHKTTETGSKNNSLRSDELDYTNEPKKWSNQFNGTYIIKREYKYRTNNILTNILSIAKIFIFIRFYIYISRRTY